MVSLMVPVGILAQKIKNLKNDVPTSEMSNFESTQSKKQLNIKPEESVEAHLKKEEEEAKEWKGIHKWRILVTIFKRLAVKFANNMV